MAICDLGALGPVLKDCPARRLGKQSTCRPADLGEATFAMERTSCYNGCRALAMIKNATTGDVIATRITWCTTFLTRGLGLMFRPPLREDEAYIFDQGRESRSLTTIHMLFVFFPLAVIWLDASRRVVDSALARPFYPYYAPGVPARYYLECHPHVLERVHVGDQLEF